MDLGLRLKNLLKNNFVKLVLILLLGLVGLDLVFPLPSIKPYSKTILAKDGTLLAAFLTDDHKWRLRTNLEDISPDLIKAIIVKEDKNFFNHNGFDLSAILKALFSNIFYKEKVSGASTITMQVVRILEPKKRTYINKLLEIVRAVQYELHYSKKEILSLYLSNLPLGGNIEGIKSASYIYFNHHPKTLSLSQSIMLSIIPGNPNQLRLDRINDIIKKKRDYWINKFLGRNVFPKQDLLDALNEPIKPHRFALPLKAPQFCYYLKSTTNNNLDQLESTLDLRIQQNAENILSNYVDRIRSKKISNGTVLVIDNRNSSVVGYCGSANFKDKRNQGQVNGILSVRSPGSTLKPALYAESFELGFLTPGIKLLDVPVELGGYEPENFDLKYNGFVTSEFALVNSLNIPAVLLLNQLGVKTFVELLESSGFKEIKNQKSKLGLSMILGGCSVTAEELGNFYATFSRAGNYKKLAYTKMQLQNNDVQKLFSEETSYLIADILSGKKRNDLVVNIDFTKLPKFAWKTGTSYGKRDAWAVGFNPNYTIVVWVGNFDGEGSPFLTGAESAFPLLAELFGAIDYNSKIKWFEKPVNVIKREVCSVSGLLPTTFCKDLSKELAIKNRSHNIKCSVHQELLVSNDESIQFCNECLPDSNFKKKIFTVYEPELSTYFKNNNIEVDEIPRHNPNCISLKGGDGPKIISPSESFQYFIDKDDPQEIILSAAADPRTKIHFWYVNDQLIAKSKPGEKIFYRLSIGMFNIVCLDDLGRSSKVRINVKGY